MFSSKTTGSEVSKHVLCLEKEAEKTVSLGKVVHRNSAIAENFLDFALLGLLLQTQLGLVISYDSLLCI